MVRYRALADCFFDGVFYAQGVEFSGRKLEGYDLATATYLEILDAEKPAPRRARGQEAPVTDDL